MELKHIVNINEAEKSVTMLLYGAIGDKIDGDYFAQEINYLQGKYDEIVVRINSEGGKVLQGLSIFNALINSPAFIVINIDGVAASMAGVIAMAGDIVRMNDFARLMVHNPLFTDRQTNLSNKEKKTLESIGSMLNQILTRRGIPEDKMTLFMEEETWFTADEALALKLIDEIIPTGKTDQVHSALASISNITSQNFTPFIDIQKETSNMKVIAILLGLAETATEAEVAAKIKEILSAQTTLQAAANELKALADKLKNEKAEAQKTQVETIADKLISDGFYPKENRDSLIAMGTGSFDVFQKMATGMKKPAVTSLSNTLKTERESGDAEAKHDFEWYRRNDSQALATMKIAEPEKFKKLADAWEQENA